MKICIVQVDGVRKVGAVMKGGVADLTARYGVSLVGTGPGMVDVYAIVAVTVAALLIGAVPAWTALRRSLADGLSIKL